jgi:ribosome-binding ATPase YchF (GTP1/OBG family)
MDALKRHLDAGKPASAFPRAEGDPILPALAELQLLTDKRAIYCANVAEAGLGKPDPHVDAVKRHAAQTGAEVVVIAARMEAELAGMSDAERAEFLASYGLQESGLDQTVRQAYRALDRISFFTHNEKEARAWTIRRGWKAPRAAGVIHTDFEKGFIRAEVVHFGDYIRLGGEAACRHAGILHVEGKEYEVRDGDVIRFLFGA